MPAEQLSGTIVVIIIAIGVQGCIMLFIFAKRQIMRFTLRNKRGPYTSLGQGAPKPLRREIDRCLEYIPYIRHEPAAAVNKVPSLNDLSKRCQLPEHFFRSAAVERYHQLERSIAEYSLSYSRLPGTSIRAFLLKCTNGPLFGVEAREIHLVCDDYEHARHHYEPFGDDQLRVFNNRIDSLQHILDENKVEKPTPTPTPVSNLAKGNKVLGRRRKQNGIKNDTFTVNFFSKRGSRTRLLQPTIKVSDKKSSAL